MTAQIVGFVSRADANLRKPKSVSKKISPNQGGVAPHYGGNEQAAAEVGSAHSVCVDTWRAWQRYHMDANGWVDIAYTGGVCNHGFAFAGRGVGVRTAANGTNNGNLKYYAVTWIGGRNQTPTVLALDAMDWWIQQLRNSGAADAVRPHSFFRTTGCPGSNLEAYSESRHNQMIVMPEQKKPTSLTIVEQIQDAVKVKVDGKWGANTDERVRRLRAAARGKEFDIRNVQWVVDTKVDGVWGPNSQGALDLWVTKFQRTIGTKSDGVWGPITDKKFLDIRREHYNNY